MLTQALTGSDPWHVAHTRPRCEKKLADFCRREGLVVELPCVKSLKKYDRKSVAFEKPLFPGYVFFKSPLQQLHHVYQNDYTANVLKVTDQMQFEQQLGEILSALSTGCLIWNDGSLSIGKAVRVRGGPLSGLSGRIVTMNESSATLCLRLDFIGQGALVVVETSNVEPAIEE
jgi:transcriptional antiterminator RfaH